MRVIGFNNVTNTLRVEPESFDDLYILARVIAIGDDAEAKTFRRFRPSEGDVGEQKEVIVKVGVEKIEIDKNADKLRLSGKILSGRPEEFIRLGSYHTLNIGPGDELRIAKEEWKDYLLRRVKQAVLEGKRPKLGIVAVDDEKATLAYIKGYGIEIITELYSKLSKRMKEKDYLAAREAYFNDIIKSIENMKVDAVVLAGPGFTKDDIKKYIAEKRVKVTKKLYYTAASDAERSGIREVMQSDVVAEIFEREHVNKEFRYLNMFLEGLRTGNSFSGTQNVEEALAMHNVGAILVNDSVINEAEVKRLLDTADKHGVHIEIFNADDDAGTQLRNFKDMVAVSKSLMKE